MDAVLSNIFFTSLAQQVGPLLIKGRKVSQRCRLGCGQPKGPAIGLGDILYSSFFCTIDLE